MVLISPLNSSASPCLSCEHAFSIEAMYLPTGGDLGTITKFGPLDRIFSCALVRGVLKMFLTHILLLLLLLLLVVVVVVVVFSPVVARFVCFVPLYLFEVGSIHV